jgi:hypothetical protein
LLLVPENVTVLGGVEVVLPELAWTTEVAARAGVDRVRTPMAASALPSRQRHRVFSVLDPFVRSP